MTTIQREITDLYLSAPTTMIVSSPSEIAATAAGDEDNSTHTLASPSTDFNLSIESTGDEDNSTHALASASTDFDLSIESTAGDKHKPSEEIDPSIVPSIALPLPPPDYPPMPSAAAAETQLDASVSALTLPDPVPPPPPPDNAAALPNHQQGWNHRCHPRPQNPRGNIGAKKYDHYHQSSNPNYHRSPQYHCMRSNGPFSGGGDKPIKDFNYWDNWNPRHHLRPQIQMGYSYPANYKDPIYNAGTQDPYHPGPLPMQPQPQFSSAGPHGPYHPDLPLVQLQPQFSIAGLHGPYHPGIPLVQPQPQFPSANNFVRPKGPYYDRRAPPLPNASTSSLASPVHPVHAYSNFPSLLTQIENQIEYYFSDENLVKDAYLKFQMDNEGWVDIRTIAGFPLIAQKTNSLDVIREALQSSDFIELQNNRMRKRWGWQKWIL